jgi:urease accessory protein
LTVQPPKENYAARSVQAALGLPLAHPRVESLEDIQPVGADLQFAVDAEGRTYLARHFATYPHHLTRTHYLDRAAPQAATVYLQSLSGGLTQDDRVAFQVSTTGRAIAHVTTQAATKVHSMDRGFASQRINLEALSESHLEYIADPTICFPRSRLAALTNICVAEGASAILSESYLWHDPHGANDIAFDTLTMETTIKRPGGRLLALDRSVLTSALGLSGNPSMLGSYGALGTVFAVGRGSSTETALAAVRGALAALPGIYAGVSLLPAEAGQWTRILAIDGAALRTAIDCAWRLCHERMLGWAADRRRK